METLQIQIQTVRVLVVALVALYLLAMEIAMLVETDRVITQIQIQAPIQLLQQQTILQGIQQPQPQQKIHHPLTEIVTIVMQEVTVTQQARVEIAKEIVRILI